ncbi:hypothetical protein FQZ97_1017210 [compost metagenome]
MLLAGGAVQAQLGRVFPGVEGQTCAVGERLHEGQVTRIFAGAALPREPAAPAPQRREAVGGFEVGAEEGGMGQLLIDFHSRSADGHNAQCGIRPPDDIITEMKAGSGYLEGKVFFSECCRCIGFHRLFVLQVRVTDVVKAVKAVEEIKPVGF